MKTQKTLKALVLSLAMAVGMLLPTVVNAQSDGFFRDEGGYANRDAGDGAYSLNNQQFGSDVNGGYNIDNQTFGQGVPLGSGLLIMVAAGGAYAFVRRKHE